MTAPRTRSTPRSSPPAADAKPAESGHAQSKPAEAKPTAPSTTAPSKGGGAQVQVTIGDTQQRVMPVATSEESNGLKVSVHRHVHPPRTGDDKQDYWTQLQVWGEITNTSSQTFEGVTARIVYFDGKGDIIGTESIASLSQEDAGDFAAGETVLGEVGFVAPGQSVPFHAMRNLAAIKGDVASFAVYPRRGMSADAAAPRGVAVDVTPFSGKIYLYGDNPWKKAAKVRTYVDCEAPY